MTLKLATWNIGRMKADHDNNRKIFSKMLSEHQPDFLFLQEYIPEADMDDIIFETTGLCRGYYKEFSQSHVAIGDRMGIAVYSHCRITENSVYALTKPNEVFYYQGRPELFHDKFFVSLTAAWRNETLVFLTGHSFSFSRYQKDPANFPEVFSALDNWLCSQIDKDRTVAIGDFNISDAVKLLPGFCKGFFDVFDGVETRPNGVKSDYIFLPNGTPYQNVYNLRCGSYDPDIGLDHNYIGVTISL